jgi:hypothetical protein
MITIYDKAKHSKSKMIEFMVVLFLVLAHFFFSLEKVKV